MAIALPELVAASAVLDPTGKALLNLWLHRDLADERIAELIGSTPERVAARRHRVAQTLAYQLDSTPEAVREAIERVVHPSPATEEPGAEEPAEAEKPAQTVEDAQAEAGGLVASEPDEHADATGSDLPDPPSPAPGPERSRRRSGLWALTLLAAVGLIAVVLATTGSGRSDPPRSTAAAPHPATKPRATPKPTAAPKPVRARARRTARPAPVRKPPRVVLTPLPGAPAKAKGALTLESHRGRTFVRLRLSGLPRGPGAYRLWLYNSVLDARPLGEASADSTFLGPLPRIKRQFRYLDVSLQPPGSRFHSGQSVLRAALARPGRRSP
jgi:hypothetical protein